MEIFINEKSIDSQFNSVSDFKEALLMMIGALDSLKDVKSTIIKRSDLLYYMNPIKDVYLSTILKANSDLSYLFKDILQKNNVKSWERTKVHLDDVLYMYDNEVCNDSSVAEFAEKKFIDHSTDGFLLNFIKSKFCNDSFITVVRDEVDNIDLSCVWDVGSINDYLITNNLIDGTKPYDDGLKIAPIDFQTVLKDEDQFEKTSYPKNNGRTVFRRIGTNELWTVDGASKHATDKAHIEVFDEKTRKHLGTSLYDRIDLDISYVVPKRKINLG